MHFRNGDQVMLTPKNVRGVGFEPTIFWVVDFLKAMFKSRAYSVHFDDNFVV